MKDQNALTVEPTLMLDDVLQNWQNISSSHDFGDGRLSFGVVEITPDIAAQLLRTQDSNRNVSDSRVLEYARRQEQGEWALSDALKFDDGGKLIDGQHRLMAVCRSGASLPFPIVSGYPKHCQDVLDIGMNRTVAQIGQIQGLNISTNHVSMVRAFFLTVTQSKSTMGMLTSPQKVLSLITQHQEAIEFAQKRHGSSPLNFAPVRAMIARAWYHENRKRLEEFLYVFDTGFANGVEDSAAVSMRNVILELRAKKVDGNTSTRKAMANKACSAVEKFLAKEESKVLREKSVCKWKIAGVDA